ncbi:hypothetical protein [Aequorivita lipolytica]|uniref:Uncharacterized protein n=1 Tax=Aequorivita lipolytica TaxID=153267 RepID=A0A5C6YNQ3_9FLAO|nr:hypothetical protein [Aequorivita lipolytica]TXD68970.1 hypothetical protein ESV24_09465 [Aequorivita lipolytica]SRX53037.1 hypothetical protein AEQU2_02281 [Aequorivita lipolytica]
MNILDRYKKPTPKFFRILRNIGLALVASGGAILAAPVVMPGILVTIATYITVIGTVISSISQAVVADTGHLEGPLKKEDNEL